MKKYSKKQKKMTRLIIWSAIAIVGVGAVGYLTSGFTNWNKEDVYDRLVKPFQVEENEEETPPSSSSVPEEEESFVIHSVI